MPGCASPYAVSCGGGGLVNGEDHGVKQGLRALGVGYVLALKPSHAWWHPDQAIGSFQEAAQAAGWKSPERPGKWIKVTRTFRYGSSQDWWALEVISSIQVKEPVQCCFV